MKYCLKRICIIITLSLTGALCLAADKVDDTMILTEAKSIEIMIGPMSVSWYFRSDRVYFHARSPSPGWVAIGFNLRDSIVGASLIMAAANGDSQQFEDQFVTAPGTHPSVRALGQESLIQDQLVIEDAAGTVMEFSLPIKHDSPYHILPQPGESLFLIAAYSASDDFQHHSIFRQHTQMQF